MDQIGDVACSEMGTALAVPDFRTGGWVLNETLPIAVVNKNPHRSPSSFPQLEVTDLRQCSLHNTKKSTGRTMKLLWLNVAIVCACFHAEACQPGQQRFEGFCYQLLNESMTWDQGDAACLEMGTALVIPESMDEQNFIYKMYGKKKDLWIGCNDKEQEGKWVKSSEEGECNFLNWAPKEPNGGVGFDCMQLRRSFNLMDDTKCWFRKGVICQSLAPLAVPTMSCLQRYADARSSSHCLTGHVIKEFSAKGVIACGLACLDEPRCRSFNLRRGGPGEMFCQLNNITRVSAIHDFTCITKPRINISSEDTYIAAYLHGGNATLSFARTTYTYTSVDRIGLYNQLELPSGHRFKLRPSSEEDEISILRLPAAGGKTRIGAFACRARMMGREYISIGTVIMSKNADFLPTRVSQTVNSGDAVDLTVTVTDPARTNIRWRKNGGEVFRDKSDSLYFDFISASVSDTGIYEAQLAGERNRGNQALMRLIVRACQKNKWNAPSCDRDCPVCFNGGMCDDRSGDCICPPGFSGEFCKRPIDPNRFGQSGSFRCDSPELGGGPTCAGMLFCLPDPYGCSCAAGYQGIDCDEPCADGFYGADCAQTCHCMDGVACNGTTGECPGDCAPVFKGINCQKPCTNYSLAAFPDEIQSLTLEPSRNDIRVTWTSTREEVNLCPAPSYRVSYQLLNLEQCQPQTDSAPIHAAVVNSSGIELTSMHAYSTYGVRVEPGHHPGEDFSERKTVTTDEIVPLAAPEVDSVSSSNQITRVSWHPIPCGKRGGDITGYTYELRDASGSMIQIADTTAESVEVDGLSQGASYSFRLWASTRVGPGPWIEFSMVIIKVDSGSSVANTVFIGGVGIAIGIILATAVALLIAFASHYRKRSQKAERSASSPMPETRAHDDAEAIYIDIHDDIELKKMSAAPSRGSATGASTVPSRKSATRASAPRASTKRSTTKATKTTKMAASQSGAHHYETTIIL
ncbi:uncharacterized protein LOC119736605 [Patiria miniata]|uniref:Uncharacterized protein n=1 Tax=Patiria miniata TaxID=46514 RepID=A0A914AR68_PATMI|nr:uncharacterized protein LOC119736605 [Patiria miniata]